VCYNSSTLNNTYTLPQCTGDWSEHWNMDIDSAVICTMLSATLNLFVRLTESIGCIVPVCSGSSLIIFTGLLRQTSGLSGSLSSRWCLLWCVTVTYRTRKATFYRRLSTTSNDSGKNNWQCLSWSPDRSTLRTAIISWHLKFRWRWRFPLRPVLSYQFVWSHNSYRFRVHWPLNHTQLSLRVGCIQFHLQLVSSWIWSTAVMLYIIVLLISFPN